MIASKIHRRKVMKRLKPGRKLIVRPSGLDSKTWKYIEPILKASQRAQSETGRFKYYGYLVVVYRTYKEWKDLGISKKMARHVATCFETTQRINTSPIRTLIDTTFPSLHSKQKSRWSRALELATLAKARPDELTMLFKNHAGIAGCARLAAEQNPKKKTQRDDWATAP